MSIRADTRSSQKRNLGKARPRASVLHLLICCFAIQAASPSLFGQAGSPPAAKPRIALGVLVDTSGHQEKVIQLEREALDLLARRLDGVVTESFVFSYADKVNLLQDWSPIENGLGRVSTKVEPGPEDNTNVRTVLNDALNAALLKQESRSDVNLNVLVVIGEGNSRGSATKYPQIKKLAKSMRVQCFALLVANHALMAGKVRQFGFYPNDLARSTQGNGYDVGASQKQLDKAVNDVVKRIIRHAQANKN